MELITSKKEKLEVDIQFPIYKVIRYGIIGTLHGIYIRITEDLKSITLSKIINDCGRIDYNISIDNVYIYDKSGRDFYLDRDECTEEEFNMIFKELKNQINNL